jgi:hypothetical protein
VRTRILVLRGFEVSSIGAAAISPRVTLVLAVSGAACRWPPATSICRSKLTICSGVWHGARNLAACGVDPRLPRVVRFRQSPHRGEPLRFMRDSKPASILRSALFHHDPGISPPISPIYVVDRKMPPRRRLCGGEEGFISDYKRLRINKMGGLAEKVPTNVPPAGHCWGCLAPSELSLASLPNCIAVPTAFRIRMCFRLSWLRVSS